MDEKDAELRLIVAALARGEAAADVLEVLLEELASAKTHAYRGMYCRGFLASIGKHNCLDEAEQLADDAYEHIDGVRKALSRLKPKSRAGLDIVIDRLPRLADFLNGLWFGDWVSLKTIQESWDRVHRAANELSVLLDHLAARRDALRGKTKRRK